MHQLEEIGFSTCFSWHEKKRGNVLLCGDIKIDNPIKPIFLAPFEYMLTVVRQDTLERHRVS